MSKEFSYEIIEEIGTIGSPTASGWSTRLNLIAWNGGTPKLDIRSWNEDMTRMGKGVTFSKEDAKDLEVLLNSYLGLSEDDLDHPLTNEEMLAELKEQGGM
jgi:conserved hypothetical protein